MDSQSKRIKVGIIGTGVGIRTHLKGFRCFEDKCEICAIAGSNLEKSKKFALEYDIPIACTDYKELCNIDDLDLVCIAAPNKFHKEMLLYAISKNKNIICEKPMVNDEIEAKEIYEVTKDYNKILIIDHQLRFNPYILKIKELIDAGTLGKIYNVDLNQQGTSFADAKSPWSWSFDAKEFGGVRLAMASHFTDLIDFWFNAREIVSVDASINPITKERLGENGEIKKVSASTTCDAFIKLKDELIIHYSINAGSYIGSKFDIKIFGDKGELTFSLEDKLKLYLRADVGNGINILLDNVFKDELNNQISIFSGSFRYLAPQIIKAIQHDDNEGIKNASTPKNSVYCMRILDAIRRSSNECKGISFTEERNGYF